MRKIILLSSLFICCFATYASAEADTSPLAVSDPDFRMARYLAGVSLIRGVPDMGTMERAEQLRALAAVTGITAAEASVYLEEYRRDPVRWAAVSGAIVNILTGVFENTDGRAPAVPNKQKEKR